MNISRDSHKARAGHSGRRRADFLKERRIEAHILPTTQAAELYNRLAKERPVGGSHDLLKSVVMSKQEAGRLAYLASASDKNEAKHSSKITKARAERIALTKAPGGSIRSAELETARGQLFWSVYIAKPGSKNAKEIRVDATSGQILAVQTERPEDQAEEPPKTYLRNSLAAKALIYG
jgi:hypothetical protein